MIRKIAVCDDEQQSTHHIELYLKQLQSETNDTFEIFYFKSGEELLKDMPRDIQILLLDIQMGELSGMDVAKQLRNEGLQFHLFFITSRIEYAIEGYEVHAYAFLKKPLQYTSFKRNMLEVFEKLDKKKKAVLTIKTGSINEVIPHNKILYIEVYKHITQIVLSNKILECTIPISELENQLVKSSFFRCHKSYLVNYAYISKYDFNTIYLHQDYQIPISKYRRKEFIDGYTNYLGESL